MGFIGPWKLEIMIDPVFSILDPWDVPNLDVFVFIYFVLFLILIITLFAIHRSFLTARLPLEELLEEKSVIFV